MYVAIAMTTCISSSMNAAPVLCLGCDDRGFVAIFEQTRPHEQRISACCTVLEENDYFRGAEKKTND